ncbi:MAG: PEP-CTERM sorting domain-containing protein [Lacunisphaera sp.]|nr:PEP-CTERM sorting domain-containing protein [Lacunisphaera sp.]
MKMMRVLMVLFLGMLVQSSLFAQIVNFLIVEKVHDYTQTDNSTTVDATNPWRFEAHVEGSTLSGIPAPTITIPSGSGATTMIYNAVGDKWTINTPYATQGALDAAYGNGTTYSITARGETISPISLTGDSYPLAPLATNLSGGTIVGGILAWNVAQALTITITGTADHMGIDVNGMSYNNGIEAFSVGTLTFVVPAASMVAGNNYTVELNFDNFGGGTLGTVGTGLLTGAQYAGIYNSSTQFTIQAIPEPSTYAAILGAVALGGVMIRRRHLLRAS